MCIVYNIVVMVQDELAVGSDPRRTSPSCSKPHWSEITTKWYWSGGLALQLSGLSYLLMRCAIIACSRSYYCDIFFSFKFDKLSHVYQDNKPGMQKVMAAITHYRICTPDRNDKARNFCCGAHNLVPHPPETSICKNSNRQYGPKHSTVVALMLQLLLAAHFPDT